MSINPKSEIRNPKQIQNFKFKTEMGFTLIEVLVVMTLFVLIGILGMNFFASVLSGSNKATVINEVKQSGAHSLSLMERFIRNAEKVTDDTETLCSINGDDKKITILNPDGGKTAFMFIIDGSNYRIASFSGGIPLPPSPTPTPIYLTGGEISIDNTSDYYFKCSRLAGRPDKIEIVFTLGKMTSASGIALPPDKKTKIPFKTSVSLRNY